MPTSLDLPGPFQPVFRIDLSCEAAQEQYPATQIRRVSQLSADQLTAVRERALNGDADAQVIVGLAYGGANRIFKRDPMEAHRSYEKSAKQGNLDAEFWLELSKAGHVGAMNMYANLCAEGTDGPLSYSEAMLWWKTAAEAGSAEAAFNVAILHLEGEGVAANEKEAVRWLRRADDRGSVPTAARLGSMAMMALRYDPRSASPLLRFAPSLGREREPQVGFHEIGLHTLSVKASAQVTIPENEPMPS